MNCYLPNKKGIKTWPYNLWVTCHLSNQLEPQSGKNMGVTSLDVATGLGGVGGGDRQRATLKKGKYFEANFLLIKTKLCLGGVSLQFCPRGTLFMIIGRSSQN